MCEAAGAQSAPRLRHCVVASKLVDDDRPCESPRTSSGVLPLRSANTINHELRRYEAPHETRRSRSCCRMLVSSAFTSAAAGTSARAAANIGEFLGAAMQQVARCCATSGCPRCGTPSRAVLRIGVAALVHDQVRDKTWRIRRLLTHPIGRGCRHDMPATTGERFAVKYRLRKCGCTYRRPSTTCPFRRGATRPRRNSDNRTLGLRHRDGNVLRFQSRRPSSALSRRRWAAATGSLFGATGGGSFVPLRRSLFLPTNRRSSSASFSLSSDSFASCALAYAFNRSRDRRRPAEPTTSFDHIAIELSIPCVLRSAIFLAPGFQSSVDARCKR